MVEINKIYNCKNQDILPFLPDKSIQIFLEDTPYGLTACHWDKKQDLQEYWELRLSKIKDNGCFVLFGSEPFSSYLRMSNIKMYKYDWIWDKQIGGDFLNAKLKPMKRHENIIIFSNAKTSNGNKNNMVYNPILENKCKKDIRPKNKTKILINDNVMAHKKSVIKHSETYNNKLKYPTSIISISKYKKDSNPINRIHPTQKPIALFEYLIETYSNKNDLIFDGFSGSGTTAIACYNLNRQFICCELEKEYFDKSIIRLAEARNNLFDGIK